MKEQFLQFVKEQKLFDEHDKCLLTVSGGRDSVAMLNMFSESGFDFAVAHCNFSLRGEESDGDEEFVRQMVKKLNMPFHTIRFDTVGYAEKHKISIQMAARDLRYSWFNELATEYGYSKIAVAHNTNDVVETFFINLTRGTGIHGLTGINIIKDKIIRPVMFATREQINEYVQEKRLAFREDSSNASTKYMRNAIRHNVIPELERLNPSFLTNVVNTIRILREAEFIYNNHLKNLREIVLSDKKDGYTIEFKSIEEENISPVLLYELLLPFGFSFDTSEKMLGNISGQSGAVYYSDKWKIIKDRKAFFLEPLKDKEHEEYYIYAGNVKFDGPVVLKINYLKLDDQFVLKRNKEVGTFDAKRLKFPLKLRKWQHGDYFYPFGMKGKKKLSDYFTDQKFSLFDKENVWILCSGNEVIWIINHRTDNRFCITKSTSEVVQIELMV